MSPARRVLIAVGLAVASVAFVAAGWVHAPRALADSWVRYEQNDNTGPISSAGTWTPSSNASYSGGSATMSSTANDFYAVTCPARTTGVRLIGVDGSGRGIGRYRVDSGAWTNFDQYAIATSFQSVDVQVTGLAEAAHVLRVEPTGTKNAASAGLSIGVDAFECYVVTSATTTTTAAPTTTTTAAPTTTTTPPSTTTTADPCQWEWGGVTEASPAPCQNDSDPTFMNRREALVSGALTVFALFALLVASWRNS